jgi:NAD(P)-dependent dehydrogenase (short-subunit alcohol dehydrogenase family)
MTLDPNPSAQPGSPPNIYQLFNLDGKSAIVTGAGRGLGQAMANALAQAGASVAVFDVNREDAEAAVAEMRASGGQAMAVAIDVTDSQQSLAIRGPGRE